MKNPFKRTGFDSVISAGTSISGTISLTGTIVVDGTIQGQAVVEAVAAVGAGTLVVRGEVYVKTIKVENVTVFGDVVCDDLVVNVLAVKNGASVNAKRIQYRSLVVEPNARLSGVLEHNLNDIEAGTADNRRLS